MRAEPMVEKRDSTAKRLKNFVAQEQDRQSLPRELEALGVRIGMLALRQDWSDPRKRAIAAHLALQITEPEEPLQRAFELFGLDPEDPTDWRRLVSYFAQAYFASKRAGAPTKWTKDRYANLVYERDFVIRKYQNRLLKTPIRSREKMVRDLMRNEKLFSGRYRALEDDTLKRQIKKALDWEKTSRADPGAKVDP